MAPLNIAELRVSLCSSASLDLSTWLVQNMENVYLIFWYLLAEVVERMNSYFLEKYVTLVLYAFVAH